ncbi:MAG: transcription factor S [Candidatus Nanoarchaeia archaeon]
MEEVLGALIKMEFCHKCKTLMLPSKKIAICPRCGSRIKAEKSDILIKEKLPRPVKERTFKRAPKEIEGTFPIADAECPKCGNKKAYWWTQITTGAIGDEDTVDTQFFRCTKCKYTWRKSAG